MLDNVKRQYKHIAVWQEFIKHTLSEYLLEKMSNMSGKVREEDSYDPLSYNWISYSGI